MKLKKILQSYFSILIAVGFTSFAAQSDFNPETTIWFAAPAQNFTESSPLGNGRLGAMMFGGVDEERVVLNESSVWSGSRQDTDRPDAYKVLTEIRRLLLEGKNSEAEMLVNANFTCQGPGCADRKIYHFGTSARTARACPQPCQTKCVSHRAQFFQLHLKVFAPAQNHLCLS